MSKSTETTVQDRKWKKIRTICKSASELTRRATEKWAEAAYKMVSDNKHVDWRWLLADMRERCFAEDIECPYTVTYLVVLAETYEAVEGDFDRGVPISVLIEGRRLDNLLDIIEDEPKMTVARMKAIVAKEANEDEERSVEEIEADAERERKEKAEEAKMARAIKRIESWDSDKANDFLTHLRREATAYTNAITRILDEDVEFSGREVTKALRAVTELAETLEEIAPKRTRVKAA